MVLDFGTAIPRITKTSMTLAISIARLAVAALSHGLFGQPQLKASTAQVSAV